MALLNGILQDGQPQTIGTVAQLVMLIVLFALTLLFIVWVVTTGDVAGIKMVFA